MLPIATRCTTPWRVVSARRRHQCPDLRRRCRLAISCALPRLARAPAGATGCLVHHLGDTLRVSTCDNPPAGHAAAVERTGGVGVRLGAARLAGPRPTRPDTTTRRRRWKGHFGVATSRRQSAARRHTAILMREHGIGRICTRDTDFNQFPFLEVIDPLRPQVKCLVDDILFVVYTDRGDARHIISARLANSSGILPFWWLTRTRPVRHEARRLSGPIWQRLSLMPGAGTANGSHDHPGP
jgi:hypothetical protein